MNNPPPHRTTWPVVVVLLLGVWLLWADRAYEVQAEPLTAAVSQTGTSSQTTLPADLSCRTCHGDTDAELTFPSGEQMSVQVDVGALDRSVHGRLAESPLACADCHRPASDYRFPHAAVEAVDLDTYRLVQSLACEHCHSPDPHLTSHPGPESNNPVLCADCHTGHEVQSTAAWQAGTETTACLTCHVDDDAIRLTTLIQAGMFAPEPTDTYCLACHTQPDLTLTLANGDVLDLTVDPDDLAHSVHGPGNEWGALSCTNCHENYLYPHEPVTAVSARDYSLEKYTACATCHEQNYHETLDNVHGAALAAGQLEAAMCTDCHGAHDTQPPSEPRQNIGFTCQECHSTIYGEYADSVHGASLLADDNPDVPTCVDCHGVHNIVETTDQFLLQSPQTCAQCHVDEEMMARYDISTDVFSTYVADYHGTTVSLFDHDDPLIQANMAVCSDCHGVHNIMAVDDPHAGISIKENLLITCQECHPDATINFPDAWTSHHQPSLEHNVLTFLVTTFYQIFLPLVLGSLGFLVLTDIYRRIRFRFQAG
jgi:predicted CXXCH cytochrome family protein